MTFIAINHSKQNETDMRMGFSQDVKAQEMNKYEK